MMNGFRVWVDGPQGTTVLVLAMLVAGFALGYWWALRPRRVSRRVRRELAERAEERAALRWVRRVGRPPELHHEKRTSTAAFLDPPDPAAPMAWSSPLGGLWPVPELAAHQAWLAHSEQAIDLANDQLTDSAYTEDMAVRMDRFLDRLLADYPAPAEDGPQ